MLYRHQYNQAQVCAKQLPKNYFLLKKSNAKKLVWLEGRSYWNVEGDELSFRKCVVNSETAVAQSCLWSVHSAHHLRSPIWLRTILMREVAIPRVLPMFAQISTQCYLCAILRKKPVSNRIGNLPACRHALAPPFQK